MNINQIADEAYLMVLKLKLLQEKLKVKVLERVERPLFCPNDRAAKRSICIELRFLTSEVRLRGILAVAKAQVL